MTAIRLRPTGLLAYDNCPRSYHYQYVLGIKSVMTDANLVFGTVVHAACTGWLQAQVGGKPFAPVQTLREAWEQATATQSIDYPSTFTPTELAVTGESLVRQFPAVWKATGLMPLIGPDGSPLVEVRLEAEVVPGVILSGKPDIVAMDREAGIVILDLKTASSAAAEGFVTVAEQLTAGQVLIETHAERLGLIVTRSARWVLGSCSSANPTAARDRRFCRPCWRHAGMKPPWPNSAPKPSGSPRTSPAGGSPSDRGWRSTRPALVADSLACASTATGTDCSDRLNRSASDPRTSLVDRQPRRGPCQVTSSL